MLDIIAFDVDHGQSIFLYPQADPKYGLLIDCGNTPTFEPVDFLIRKNLLYWDGQKYLLRDFTLTNYDQDHFSGLPYLRSRVEIATIHFAKNLTTQELRLQKPVVTDALKHICQLQDTYVYPVTNHTPPYQKVTFALSKGGLAGEPPTTNNLSQIVFVKYGGSVICVAGDLEKGAWAKLVATYPAVPAWLASTNVLVAAHHGRRDGYAEEIFDHCSPECVIISDKQIVYGTQEGMSQAYANHVRGAGVSLLSGRTLGMRKVLTTRSDGHIWVRFTPNGTREYRTFQV